MKYIDEVLNLLMSVPPDFKRAEKILSENDFTKEDIAEIAICCTENCHYEYGDAILEGEPVQIEKLNSYYILDVLKLLLKYNLDSNIVVEGNSTIWNAIWIDAPGLGASVLRLLFENGGNPNHFIPEESETLFEYVDFMVAEDDKDFFYRNKFQCWLVLMAYGACFSNGEIPCKMLGGNSVEIFKNFENYDYTDECYREKQDICYILHIYDKETKEDVAVCG